MARSARCSGRSGASTRTGRSACQSDAQLLERFRTHRDRSAFEVLVGRHGRMVLAVCREVLGDPDDAEDAFQATFLLLARKAGSLRVGRTLAGWLHRVGYRVAMQAGIAAGRRRRHEERAAALAARAVERPADAVVEAAEGRRRAARRARPPARSAEDPGRALLPRGPELCRGRVAPGRPRGDRARAAGAPATGSATGSPAAGSPRPRRRAGSCRPRLPGSPPCRRAWSRSTARAASCVTLAPAGRTASSLALMQEVLGTMIASKLKAAAAGLAAILALAWMTASLAAPAAQDGRIPRRIRRRRASPLRRRSPPPRPSSITPAGSSGRTNEPIEGAEIFLHYTTPNVRFFTGYARTDAEGRFQFDVDPSRLAKGKNGEDRPQGRLAIRQGRRALARSPSRPASRAGRRTRTRALDRIEFRLPLDDVAIEGRILDERGRPARGARVYPSALYYKQGARGPSRSTGPLRGSRGRSSIGSGNTMVRP